MGTLKFNAVPWGIFPTRLHLRLQCKPDPYDQRMPTHNAVEFVSELGMKLASRTRHVSFFFGAGTSRACGLPDVAGLQADVLSKLDDEARAQFERLLAGRNLEQALSRIRRIAALVEDGDTVDGLSAHSATDLDAKVCTLIAQRLSSDDTDLDPVIRLAHWLGRASYSRPVEVFTVNYDLLLETALDQLAIPYFDGFVGTLRARFRADMVDALPSDPQAVPTSAVRLWKLHGSLNWCWNGETSHAEVVRMGHVVSGSPVAIFPSDTKYEESRRVPFVVLQDRLRRGLHEPESLTLVCGYSWSDEHLNELFIDAASRRPRSETVVLCYGDIPERLATEAVSIPNLQVIGRTEAVIAGMRGSWQDPGSNFPDVWSDGFMLGDFGALSSFLARANDNVPIEVGSIDNAA